MLDENKEFLLLLNFDNSLLFKKEKRAGKKTVIETKETELLLCKNLQENLSGMRRALTILARGFLFDEAVLKWEKENRIKGCEEFLRYWFKGTKISDEFYATITEQQKNTFNRFITSKNFSAYISSLKNSKNSEQMETCKTYNKSYIFKKTMMQNADKSDNKRNAISTEVIIADALFQGHLQTQKLVVKKELLDKKALIENTSLKDGKKKRVGEPAMCSILCFTVAYLKELEKSPEGQKFVPFNLTDLSNFKGVSTKSLTTKGNNFSYKGEPIIERAAIGGNRSKLCINEGFITDFDIRLASAEEKTDYTRYYTFSDFDLR